jgi:hypothetical protein
VFATNETLNIENVGVGAVKEKSMTTHCGLGASVAAFN